MDGRVVWITGLSGAGKTTIARALQERLPDAILLDGDDLREVMGAAGRDFDVESRKKLALTYARLAAMIARQGKTVIVATISLFHDVHAWNRKHNSHYLEVFLDVSEKERGKRDPKGLYMARRKGEIKEMAGMDTAVEFPINPHLRLDESMDIPKSVDMIMERIVLGDS